MKARRMTLRITAAAVLGPLLGGMLLPFKRRQGRQVISRASKFYLFDVGPAGALAKRHLQDTLPS